MVRSFRKQPVSKRVCKSSYFLIVLRSVLIGTWKVIILSMKSLYHSVSIVMVNLNVLIVMILQVPRKPLTKEKIACDQVDQ